MRSRLPLVVVAVAISVGFLVQALRPASAVPVFARKYGFNCTMCHSNFPRLNDFGWRYRTNGYQIPGREEDDKTILESPTPLAMRTTAGYVLDEFDNTPDEDDVSQFRLEGLDVLSGGLLGHNIGYFMIYTPQIDESNWVAGQPGSLEMANVMFSNLASTHLNARVGRFEPAYVPFSAKRNLTFSPYEIYDLTFPGGPAFSDTQVGIELTGYTRRGCSYAVGWIDGSGSNDKDDTPSDFYLRGAKVFGEGEGQTAGHRVGAIGYFGRSKPEGSPPGASRRSFTRWGVDASLNFPQWNVGAQWLYGSDDAQLWGTAADVDLSGGFVEANYLPTTRLTAFGRYDWVSLPSEINEDVTRWTVGARYYLEDNLAWHTEFSRRTQDSATLGVGDATESFFTTRMDVAF